MKETLIELFNRKILPLIRERYWDEKFMGGPFFKPMFQSYDYLARLARFEFISKRLPEFDPKKSEGSWLPINRNIEGAGSLALPEEVTDRLIDKAKHRVILDFCYCRKAMGCKDYPIDLGCIMMGESALEIPAKVSREVGPEEAKAHVRRALDAGLIPVTGKIRPDNDFLMVPDRGKLLTLCFCCECCCVTRIGRHIPRDTLDAIFRPLEGLSIEVAEECSGCGECVEKCYIGAIEIRDGVAVIGDLCRLCGRCALHCPQEAIKLRLDNPGVVDDVVRRIEGAVDF